MYLEQYEVDEVAGNVAEDVGEDFLRVLPASVMAITSYSSATSCCSSPTHRLLVATLSFRGFCRPNTCVTSSLLKKYLFVFKNI